MPAGIIAGTIMILVMMTIAMMKLFIGITSQ